MCSVVDISNTVSTLFLYIHICVPKLGKLGKYGLVCGILSLLLTNIYVYIYPFMHSFTNVNILTCSQSLSCWDHFPPAVHWKVAFWPTFTSTFCRRRKCGALPATQTAMCWWYRCVKVRININPFFLVFFLYTLNSMLLKSSNAYIVCKNK